MPENKVPKYTDLFYFPEFAILQRQYTHTEINKLSLCLLLKLSRQLWIKQESHNIKLCYRGTITEYIYKKKRKLVSSGIDLDTIRK